VGEGGGCHPLQQDMSRAMKAQAMEGLDRQAMLRLFVSYAI
jgi:hypothetical protein